MTNKLPEVGKRYKHKTELFEVKVARLATDEIGVIVITECRRPYSSNLFEYLFEEIPDQDLNRSNNTQLEDDHIPEIRKKVEDNRFTDVGKTIEEAKEDLKDYIKAMLKKETYNNVSMGLIKYAQNLLNALDTRKEDKTDMKEESVDTKKERFDRVKDKLDKGEVYFPDRQWIGIDWAIKEPVKKTEESPLDKITPELLAEVKAVAESYNSIETEESLPKSISELYELQVLIHHQNFSAELITYLEFILDQQEQNTKDIVELEARIKKLEVKNDQRH